MNLSFKNYLTDLTQCVSIDGPIIGAVLITIYMNNIGLSVNNCKLHLYGDNTGVYFIPLHHGPGSI